MRASMRASMKTLCWSLFFLLATSGAIQAQEKGPQGTQKSRDSKPQGCLSYEPATVTLKGTISRKTFPGPPNYESVKEGDQPETYWVLHLTQPICVERGADLDDVPEEDVSDLQLVWRGEQYARNLKLLNKRVVISGKLFHSITGHHHTTVLIDVTEIRGLKMK